MTKPARTSLQKLHTNPFRAMKRKDQLSHNIVALNCTCSSFICRTVRHPAPLQARSLGRHSSKIATKQSHSTRISRAKGTGRNHHSRKIAEKTKRAALTGKGHGYSLVVDVESGWCCPCE